MACFVSLLLKFGHIQAFNVDTKSPIILEPNSRDKGLFGHSISISENSDTIIGAPESEIHGIDSLQYQMLKLVTYSQKTEFFAIWPI